MRELRGPFVGLIALALAVSLFASGLVSAARAASPAALAAHCLSAEQDHATSPDAAKDALCKLGCAFGLSSLAVDLPVPVVVPAPVFALADAGLDVTPGLFHARRFLTGGGSRAPPFPA